MARMPGAIWQGEHGGVPMSRYDIVCVHTIVGYAPAHAAHFSVKADGTILQSRDTKYKSAANLEGNDRVIAIENEDHGPAFGSWNINDGHAVPALTSAQVAANARILRWAHEVHGVPLQLCPDSRPTSRGLAYHRQGIDGNFDTYAYPGRVSGGEVWTKWVGKVCPGDEKIAQLPEILRLAIGTIDIKPKEWDEMATREEVKQACREAVRAEFTVNEPKGTTTRTAVRNLAGMGVRDEQTQPYYLASDDAEGGVWVVRADHTGKYRVSGDLWNWLQMLHALAGKSSARVSVPHAVMRQIPTID